MSAIRAHLRYGFAGTLRTPDAVALALVEAVSTTGRAGSINELFTSLDRVTPTDVQRAAAKYFIPTNESVVVLETEMKK